MTAKPGDVESVTDVTAQKSRAWVPGRYVVGSEAIWRVRVVVSR